MTSARPRRRLPREPAAGRPGEPTVPTLVRFLVIVALLGAMGYGAVWALAFWVEPEVREITVAIPPDRLGR